MANITTFGQLLSTNKIPTTSQAAVLQAEIDEYLRQISLFEEQVRRRRGALSVVRRLPGEILGEIFKHALPPGLLDSHARQSLIHFNCVCKNWRQAALMCHQLWNGVHVVGDEISFVPIQSWMARSGDLPKKLQVFVPHIKRKGNWWEDEDEIDEELEDEEKNDGEGGEGDEGGDEHPGKQANREAKDIEVPEDIRQVVRLLTNGVSLDDLRLEYSYPDDLKKLLKFLPLGGSKASSKLRPWDCINSLSLSFKLECLLLDGQDTLGYFLPRFSKNITSFELRLPGGDHFPFDDVRLLEPGFMELPQNFAEKLTSFSISCEWGVQHMLILLEDCANLEVLTLDFLHLSTEWRCTAEQYTTLIGRMPRVKLPKLHTLYLRACPPKIIRMLGSLQVPVLVHLDFEFDGELNLPGVAEDLLTFLTTESNCAPTLNSLRLTDIKLDALGFCQVLDELPALTHLVLEEVCFGGGDLLQKLDERCRPLHPAGPRGTEWHRRKQSKPFLPNLKVLKLIDLVNEGNIDHLARFIDSREQLYRTQAWSSNLVGSADGSLKELIVGYHQDSSTSPLDLNSRQRESLKRSGMNLNIFPYRF